jgi:uncharacterized protein
MRTYERNGIHVDQCTECRGLFLDRGELEHLVQAEGSYYGGEQSAPRRHEHEHEREREHHDSYAYGGKHYRKRKKNFLEELFD